MSLLGHRISDLLHEATFLKTSSIGLANARMNARKVQYTVNHVPVPSYGDSCLVIGAGPSLKRNQSIRKISKSDYDGIIVAVDGALAACLREGLRVDYVVSLDTHPDRIVRWFGDPLLSTRREDDYFRRQDLDPDLNGSETEKNEETIKLVNKHGWKIRALLSTSVAPEVAARCIEAGMQPCWWTPIYDDPRQPGSVTREAYNLTLAPCIATGGNVGSAAWVLAHSVLGKQHVGMVGMDFGYAPGTPYERTQYYHEMKALLGDRYEEGYIPCEDGWYTDPTYFWYKKCFLEMAALAPCKTYNCTDGGILSGDGIECTRLNTFLRRFS